MATHSQRLSDHSFQESMSTAYHNSLEPSCFAVSKSSSDTLCKRRSSMDDNQKVNLDLRRTHSRPTSPRFTRETGLGYSHEPHCFMSQNNPTMMNLCGCSQMVHMADLGMAAHSISHFPSFNDNIKVHSNVNINANIAMRREADPILYEEPNLGKVQVRFAHRSCSDIICGQQENCVQGSIVHNQTNATSQFWPGRGCHVIAPDNMMTKDCSQGFFLNVSRNETGSGFPEQVKDHTTAANHQANSLVNDQCSPMHQSHLMFIERSPNYPGAMFVQESGRYCQDNSMTRNERTGINQSNAVYREITANQQDNLIGNHNCAGFQSQLDTGLRFQSQLDRGHLIPGLRIDDTDSGYCHSPISSINLFPRLVSSISESGRGNVVGSCCHPVSGILAFPPLVTSMSDSGLDTRHLRCSGSQGNETFPTESKMMPNSPQHGTTLLLEKHSQPLADSNLNVNMGVRTRDMCTMTSISCFHHELKQRDAEMQTSFGFEYRSVATSPMSPTHDCLIHMFPEISLKENQSGQMSPVREVKWDNEGMTWEVYGASVDPEVLGLAIQKHLEIQIEQHEKDKMDEMSKELAIHFDPKEKSVKEKRRQLPGFRNMISSLRHPGCCVSSRTAID